MCNVYCTIQTPHRGRIPPRDHRTRVGGVGHDARARGERGGAFRLAGPPCALISVFSCTLESGRGRLDGGRHHGAERPNGEITTWLTTESVSLRGTLRSGACGRLLVGCCGGTCSPIGIYALWCWGKMRGRGNARRQGGAGRRCSIIDCSDARALSSRVSRAP